MSEPLTRSDKREQVRAEEVHKLVHNSTDAATSTVFLMNAASSF